MVLAKGWKVEAMIWCRFCFFYIKFSVDRWSMEWHEEEKVIPFLSICQTQFSMIYPCYCAPRVPHSLSPVRLLCYKTGYRDSNVQIAFPYAVDRSPCGRFFVCLVMANAPPHTRGQQQYYKNATPAALPQVPPLRSRIPLPIQYTKCAP